MNDSMLLSPGATKLLELSNVHKVLGVCPAFTVPETTSALISTIDGSAGFVVGTL